jgi:hypothetical protein
MKQLILLVCIGLACAWPAQAGTAGEGDFVLVKQEKGLSIYERWITNAGGDKTREVKAIFQVQCTVNAATRLLMDAQRGKEWNLNAETFSVLSLNPVNQWVTYIRFDIPWPVGDQDCCLLYTLRSLSADGALAEVYFESTAHNRFPVDKKATRITGISGKWMMEKAGGVTRITYMVSTDRSSKIPRWISDKLVRNHLAETMMAYKKTLEQ